MLATCFWLALHACNINQSLSLGQSLLCCLHAMLCIFSSFTQATWWESMQHIDRRHCEAVKRQFSSRLRFGHGPT